MELPVSMQTIQLVLTILFGICLGIYYDVLRVLREKLRLLTHPLDFLFCLTTLVAALLFALYVGLGQFRLFFFLGITGGMVLWFLTLSRLFRLILRKILRIISAPFGLLWQLFKKICKKIKKFAKNIFSFAKKWFMIKESKWQHARKQNKHKGGRRNAVSENIPDGQADHPGSGGVRYHYADIPAVADSAGKGRKHRKAAAAHHTHPK